MNKNCPSHVFKQISQVSRDDRLSLFKNKPLTIWLTGLSASGKSTLAFALEQRMVELGHACYVLDGDNIRHGLNRDLDFTKEGRAENIRRVAEVARLMNDAGLIVIAAFISPLISDRNIARSIIGEDSFLEVYLSTSLSVCESRDPKGLYLKARSGDVKEFTGISAKYEPPVSPTITLDTQNISIEQSIISLLPLILNQ
jgi:adenylyl-sulfate kinase